MIIKQQQEEEDYQYKYPPDYELCKKHRLATRIWRGITYESVSTETCHCCGRKVGLETFQKQCIHQQEQYAFLGPGIPLYFKFLKYSALILIIFCLVFGIYSLYSNIIHNSCSKTKKCALNIFNQMSIINKKDSQQNMIIQNYILLGFVGIYLIILHILRYNFRKYDKQINELEVSAGDYAIILKRLPKGLTEQKITKAFDQKIKVHNLNQQLKAEQLRNMIKIQKVVLAYDLQEYNRKKQLQKQKFKEYSLKQKNGQNNIKFNNIKIQKPTSNGYFAIVVFQNQKSKQLFIQQNNFFKRLFYYCFPPFTPLSNFQIQNTKITIERAPQPDDILWDNAHFSPCQRLQRKLLFHMISLLLLIIGALCQYLLVLWRDKTPNPTQKRLVSTIASIIVVLTNFIIKKFLIYSTKHQKIYTQTEYFDILTFKLTFQQFLNSGIFVVGAYILAHMDNYQLQHNLSETITQIMIFNVVLKNIKTLIMKYFDILGRVKRYLFLQKKIIFCNQLKANRLYQLPRPNFPSKYSFIIKTLILTAFYAPLVPVVVPISALGLITNYYLQKFLFSTSYSVSKKISSSLNKHCIQGLQYLPLILSIGQLLTYAYLEHFHLVSTPPSYYTIIYLSISLSFTNFFIPSKQFSNYIKGLFKNQNQLNQQSQMNKINQKMSQLTYQQARKKFQITYYMTNPIYNQQPHKRRDNIVEKQAGNWLRRSITNDINMKQRQDHTQKGYFSSIMKFNEWGRTSHLKNDTQQNFKSQQKINPMLISSRKQSTEYLGIQNNSLQFLTVDKNNPLKVRIRSQTNAQLGKEDQDDDFRSPQKNVFLRGMMRSDQKEMDFDMKQRLSFATEEQEPNNLDLEEQSITSKQI